MLTLLLYLSIFVLSLAFHALFLRWGAWLAKIPGVTYRRALATTALYTALAFAVPAAILWSGGSAEGASFAFLLGPLIAWLAIWLMFRTSLWRAILAWLATVIASAIAVALVFLVVKPYILEAFIVSNNSMASTLVGPHVSATCPRCGGPLIVTFDPAFGPPEPDPVAMCFRCQQATTEPLAGLDRTSLRPDRIICNKLLSLRRWDLVTYRSPRDPATLYVKRLIGLPGEEVVLKDGGIWIDGTRLAPPPDIAQLRFEDRPWMEMGIAWGSAENPAKLGADEYFVIGDFSLASADSRSGLQDSDGLHPYALPRSSIVGVVDLIYWPPGRWRIIR